VKRFSRFSCAASVNDCALMIHDTLACFFFPFGVLLSLCLSGTAVRITVHELKLSE
jgi:hypothetical protein